MKDGGWIALDKRLAHFLPRNRPYTSLEAMFSYTKDVDEGKEKALIEYSRIWSWSRCKVRRFVTDLKTGARHVPDRDETGTRQEIRLINSSLPDLKDRRKTGARQAQDRDETGTINPNPNPDPKEKPLVAALPDWIPKEPWDRFLKMRQKIKKPLSPESFHLAFDKLQKLKDAGHDPGAVLDQSAFYSWQGLFEIKEQNNGRPGNTGSTTQAGRKTGDIEGAGGNFLD